MDQKQKKILLKSQQGELDAVPMYLRLSEAAKDEELKEIFKQLAKEEGHHAAVFYNITGEKLKPKKFKAIMLPILQKIIGWKLLLRIISKAEYSAYESYEPVVEMFDEVDSVRNDEKRHGDILQEYNEDSLNSKKRFVR